MACKGSAEVLCEVLSTRRLGHALGEYASLDELCSAMSYGHELRVAVLLAVSVMVVNQQHKTRCLSTETHIKQAYVLAVDKNVVT